MPKRLLCVAPHTLEWRDYEDPELAAGQVRVRTAFAAAKHGTEMVFFKAYRPGQFGFPAGAGNMLVGPVTEVGPEVEALAVGDRVCVYSGFRETWTGAADRCWVLPDGMSWKSAVCLDPADFAFCAVRDGHVRVGDAVAVFGLGAIGLMAVQIARLAGARPVVAADPLPNRRAVAEQLGADLVLDPMACDAPAEIKTLTDGRGVDVAIEYSGAVAALNDAVNATAYGGTIVAGAFPPPYGPGLDFGRAAHLNNLSIVFSRSCSSPQRDHPRWTERRVFDACWRLLAEGGLTGELIVRPVVPFDDLATEYPRIATEPNDFIKLGAAR